MELYAYPNLENTCNKFYEIFKSRHSSCREITCGNKFLRVLIFAIFAVFPAIRKNKFPQIKIVGHTFPAKINSRVNILQLKFTTQKYSITKSCLFNHNLSLSFRNNEILFYWVLENMYFYCTYSIKTKIFSMIGTFWKSQKLIPSKKNNLSVIAKRSSRKTQKIAYPQK